MVPRPRAEALHKFSQMTLFSKPDGATTSEGETYLSMHGPAFNHVPVWWVTVDSDGSADRSSACALPALPRLRRQGPTAQHTFFLLFSKSRLGDHHCRADCVIFVVRVARQIDHLDAITPLFDAGTGVIAREYSRVRKFRSHRERAQMQE